MKNRLLSLLLIGFIVLGLTGCGKSVESSGESNDNSEAKIVETTYHEITLDELTEMIENKESFILVIGSETSSACALYKTTMEKIITEYNIRINYINIFPLKDEETAKLRSYAYYSATPTTVFFQNGVAGGTYNKISDNESYDKVIEMLKKNDYVK